MHFVIFPQFKVCALLFWYIYTYGGFFRIVTSCIMKICLHLKNIYLFFSCKIVCVFLFVLLDIVVLQRWQLALPVNPWFARRAVLF